METMMTVDEARSWLSRAPRTTVFKVLVELTDEPEAVVSKVLLEKDDEVISWMILHALLEVPVLPPMPVVPQEI